jgi:hypothetical protein
VRHCAGFFSANRNLRRNNCTSTRRTFASKVPTSPANNSTGSSSIETGSMNPASVPSDQSSSAPTGSLIATAPACARRVRRHHAAEREPPPGLVRSDRVDYRDLGRLGDSGVMGYLQ